MLSPSEQRTHYAGLCLVLTCRKKANVDLGETNEFSQRRIYDDQNTVDLLRVVSETLGKINLQYMLAYCGGRVIDTS